MSYIDASSIEGVKVNYPPELQRTNRILVAPDINDIVKDVMVGQCTFEPFCKSDLHVHKSIEMIYVLSGEGKSSVGDVEIDLIPDRLVTIPAGVWHDFANTGENILRVLFIITPPENAADIYSRAVEAAKKYNGGEVNGEIL